MELMQANKQWATRPDDERFLSLTDMAAHFQAQRAASRAKVIGSRRLLAEPHEDNKGLMVRAITSDGEQSTHAPTHWAFGQLAQLAEAPAAYLRSLPSPIAADCINYGLQYKRDIEDVGVLLYENGSPVLRAATGPRYGRIWNSDVVDSLMRQFGDGRTGEFRVPGEFGEQVEITKANTTLYAGDRDFFVFLADEENRIEVPGRRNGQPGQLARGFFVWNSEVGSASFGVSTFLFDYVCANRIVWGASDVSEIVIRHTASAPDRFVEELKPALLSYAHSSTTSITDAIAKAKAARLDNVDEWLGKRFGKRMVSTLNLAHFADEQRPIETVYDVTNAMTAHARSIPFQDQRIAMEREAGKLLKEAA